MKKNYFIISLTAFLFLLPFLVYSQETITNQEFTYCEQYPEIKKCSKKSSNEEAKKCFNEQIQKYVDKKVSYRRITYVINKTLKDTMTVEDYENIRGKRLRIKNKIRLMVGTDKEWHVKSVDTEYPRLIPYFEKVFKGLPEIKKNARCSGKAVNLVFNIPIIIEVPIE